MSIDVVMASMDAAILAPPVAAGAMPVKRLAVFRKEPKELMRLPAAKKRTLVP